MTSLSGSRLFPSSYNVTSPSNVARSSGPANARPIIWAVLRMRRMSLKDGGTKRREDMKRWRSWYLKASARGRRVKKVPMLGTSNFSLDWWWRFTFWWSTIQCQKTKRTRGDLQRGGDKISHSGKRKRSVLWSSIISSTSFMISAYRRWASSAIWATLPARDSNTPVGCECSTKGTARRPLIHSNPWFSS